MAHHENTPNPGSEEAIKQGCTCPVLDNLYGRGIPHKGGVMFWYNPYCTVHSKKEEKKR